MLLLELTKRLQDSDPQVRYVLTYLYEVFNEQQKQVNMITGIVKMLAENEEHIINQLSLRQTNELDQVVRDLGAFGKTDGVEVSSVANDPEKGEVD